MRVSIRPRSVRQISLVIFSLFAVGACTMSPLLVDSKATAPVIDGFGASTLVPSQANEAARRLFAQGMAQVYAFNEVEAIRSFRAALAQDPECAMCAWGIGLKMGPNINNPARGDLAMAKRYADYAVKHSKGASERDRGLIEALAIRYGTATGGPVVPMQADICTTPGSGAAHPLDIAYAAQLRELAARFPADPDVLSQYAEAEMVATRKGDWWDRTTGKPSGRIGELADKVEAALKLHPDHVGLNHYMIHAVDAVQVAPRAVPAADRLGKLAPKSPHLLHMPSHTYGLVGRYADATRVNQLAVAADEALAVELKKQNFTVSKDWRGHNGHFQWYASLMEGRSELALASARASAGRAAKSDSEFGEYIRSLPVLTLLHLQRWDALIKEPMPAGDKGVATVLGEMSRGVAMARSGQAADAKAALARLAPAAKSLVAKFKGETYMDRLIRSIVNSSEAQLGAEIALAEQRIDDALALQTKAVEAAVVADANEPPMLAGGPRYRLGKMQLQAKRYAEAEQTFRTDLAQRPANGWALSGLEQALAAQGKQADAQRVRNDLAVSWVVADSEVRAN